MGLLVSCLCPTYNRAPNHLHLLAESVESFLRQELPDGVEAELVILNDTPGQKLHIDHPWIQARNVSYRYDSLGEKRNALCGLAHGNVLLPWDDDDISLPGRIAQAVSSMYAALGIRHYFNPRRSWWLDRGVLHKDHNHGYCHNASAFTRHAWETVGGYPPTNNEDALMDEKLRAAFGVNEPIQSATDWQYIYRWSVSPCHLSGVAGGPPSDPHEPHYRRIGEQPIERGVFCITPGWQRDYVRLCAEACASTSS